MDRSMRNKPIRIFYLCVFGQSEWMVLDKTSKYLTGMSVFIPSIATSNGCISLLPPRYVAPFTRGLDTGVNAWGVPSLNTIYYFKYKNIVERNGNHTTQRERF